MLTKLRGLFGAAEEGAGPVGQTAGIDTELMANWIDIMLPSAAPEDLEHLIPIIEGGTPVEEYAEAAVAAIAAELTARAHDADYGTTEPEQVHAWLEERMTTFALAQAEPRSDGDAGSGPDAMAAKLYREWTEGVLIGLPISGVPVLLGAAGAGRNWEARRTPIGWVLFDSRDPDGGDREHARNLIDAIGELVIGSARTNHADADVAALHHEATSTLATGLDDIEQQARRA